MDEHTNTANLLEAAKTGNQKAESEILSKLFARFLPIVSLNLQKYSVLAETIDLEMKCHEVCQNAILEVKRLYPLNSEKFSVKRAVTVLHNVIDDFIINALYELARSSILRKFYRMHIAHWRTKSKISGKESSGILTY